MAEYEQYDPLDYGNLTKSCVQELMSRPPLRLPLEEAFRGAGVYALFYAGDFPPYSPVSSPDATYPIYVGSALPAGARKGRLMSTTRSAGRLLYNRIREHQGSIQAAVNLHLEEFFCRFLVVTPLWIVMVERFLIDHYKPIWNVCIDGFGLHDPGGRRYEGDISWWDALHPGRSWGGRLRQTRTSAMAEERLRAFLARQ